MKLPSILTLAQSMNRLAQSIDRASDILERAYPPPSKGKPPRITEDALIRYDPIADYEAELEEERLREQGRGEES